MYAEIRFMEHIDTSSESVETYLALLALRHHNHRQHGFSNPPARQVQLQQRPSQHFPDSHCRAD
jgi:hypothetical protein